MSSLFELLPFLKPYYLQNRMPSIRIRSSSQTQIHICRQTHTNHCEMNGELRQFCEICDVEKLDLNTNAIASNSNTLQTIQFMLCSKLFNSKQNTLFNRSFAFNNHSIDNLTLFVPHSIYFHFNRGEIKFRARFYWNDIPLFQSWTHEDYFYSSQPANYVYGAAKELQFYYKPNSMQISVRQPQFTNAGIGLYVFNEKDFDIIKKYSTKKCSQLKIELDFKDKDIECMIYLLFPNSPVPVQLF